MAVIESDLVLTSRLRSHAQMTPSRPPEYLQGGCQSVFPTQLNSASRHVQDRVVAVDGEPVDSQTVAAGRIGKREHIADPLARLTSHLLQSDKLRRVQAIEVAPLPYLVLAPATRSGQDLSGSRTHALLPRRGCVEMGLCNPRPDANRPCRRGLSSLALRCSMLSVFSCSQHAQLGLLFDRSALIHIRYLSRPLSCHAGRPARCFCYKYNPKATFLVIS